MPTRPPSLTKTHFERLATWRHTLHRFLHFSQEAAHAAGLTPQQHQALLAIKGFPDRDYVSMGELALRLQLRPHSTVGLVDRLVRRQLLQRRPSTTDRRRVELRLTVRGERLLGQLSAAHWRELRQLAPEFRQALEGILAG